LPDQGREQGRACRDYIDRVQETSDQDHEEFFASWAEAGYGENGEATAVDVSVPAFEVEE
jgi:hypothetical protein